MATNVTLTTAPEQWNSAYSPTQFVFDFEDKNISSATQPSAGLTRITVSSAFSVTPPVGSYVYIDSGTYMGLWLIVASTSTTVDFKFTWSINQNSGTLKNLRCPVFSLYKGFKTGEQFEVELPYTWVSDFKYQFNSDLQLVIDLRGILQNIFTIESPDLETDFDFSIFNAFRLVWDTDNETDISYVLNSSITTTELNESYIVGDNYLTNVQPLMFGCGITFVTKFKDGFPVTEVYNSGTQTVAGFSAAFQSNQFSQGYDIN